MNGEKNLPRLTKGVSEWQYKLFPKKNILYLWLRLISSNDSWNWYLEFLEDIFVFLCVQFSRQLESKNFSFGIPFGIYIIFFLNPESRWDSTFLPNCTFFVIKVKSNNFSQSLFESSQLFLDSLVESRIPLFFECIPLINVTFFDLGKLLSIYLGPRRNGFLIFFATGNVMCFVPPGAGFQEYQV